MAKVVTVILLIELFPLGCFMENKKIISLISIFSWMNETSELERSNEFPLIYCFNLKGKEFFIDLFSANMGCWNER